MAFDRIDNVGIVVDNFIATIDLFANSDSNSMVGAHSKDERRDVFTGRAISASRSRCAARWRSRPVRRRVSALLHPEREGLLIGFV
jgi:hypothetical protein